MTAATVYGKRVEHLRSVIKSCGMRFLVKLSRSLKKLYVGSYSQIFVIVLFLAVFPLSYTGKSSRLLKTNVRLL